MGPHVTVHISGGGVVIVIHLTGPGWAPGTKPGDGQLPAGAPAVGHLSRGDSHCRRRGLAVGGETSVVDTDTS